MKYLYDTASETLYALCIGMNLSGSLGMLLSVHLCALLLENTCKVLHVVSTR